jgi:hypothetical protein
LMKDPVRGTREIVLEPGAHGVVLTVTGGRATRRSADGRWPVATGTHYSGTAIHQIHPAGVGSHPAAATAPAGPPALEVDEITILTGWAEGVSEALAYAPEQAQALLADAYAEAAWRVALQLPAPTPRLRGTIDSIRETLRSATPSGGFPSFDGVLRSVREDRTDAPAIDRLSRRVLRSTLEQLRTRQASEPVHS